MKEKIHELMDMFPYFFDKSETSNFFKSQSVTNNQLLKVYQSILDVKDSLRLDKRCLIWKEQVIPYDYTINFVANYPHLKKVTCYKNDDVIYMREYLEESNVNYFEYSYESTDNYTQNNNSPIIPEDTFKIIVETYDEYIITKGFPENDTILGNEYDHDESLDEIGVLSDIPRKTYIPTENYANTEPLYNNRLTEDDYHYMNRIIYYTLHIHDTPLPILEVWKEYGISATMENREKYLLKMFDETQHPEEDWTPQIWEHKDRLCTLDENLGKFFFVSANTLLPAKNQNVKFNFKYMNMLAEELTGDYNVTITLGETTLEEHYTGGQYIVSSEDIDEDDPNIFTFSAYEGTTLFATEELIVNVRGCSTADWYVNPSGSDSNDGKSSSTPFKTISKALSMVNGEEHLIVLSSGTYTITNPLDVPFSCTILGCGDAEIENTSNLKFFKIYQNQSLNIQDVTLTNDTNSMLVDDATFINNNLSNTPLYVILQEALSGLVLTVSKSYVKSSDTITVNITLTDENGDPVEGASVDLYKEVSS